MIREMLARMIWAKASPDLIDTWAETTKEALIPAARTQEGYCGYVAIFDRASGVAMALTLWNDEATERRSDEGARETREFMARAVGAELRVDKYEVAAAELLSSRSTTA